MSDSTTETCDQNPGFIVMATNNYYTKNLLSFSSQLAEPPTVNCAIKEFYLFESRSLETVVHVNWCSILFNKCDSGLFLRCDWVSCNTINW